MIQLYVHTYLLSSWVFFPFGSPREMSRAPLPICRFSLIVYFMCVCALSRFSHIQLFVTPWTVAHQAPLSGGFSRPEYWSGFSHSPPGDLLDSGIEPLSLTSPALAGSFFTSRATCEDPSILHTVSIVHARQLQLPNSSHPLPFPLGICILDFYIYVSVSALQIRSYVPFF